MLGDLLEGTVGEVEAFRLGAQADDGLDLLRVVGVRGDDEEAGEEVWGDAVRGDDVARTADDSVAAVGGEDDDGGDGGFEGAVEVGEAFHVEHVDLFFGLC